MFPLNKSPLGGLVGKAVEVGSPDPTSESRSERCLLEEADEKVSGAPSHHASPRGKPWG